LINFRSVIVLAILLPGLLQSCAVTAAESIVVQPCKHASDDALPVVRECVAAAIAERAFLEATKHEITQYSIFSLKHTPTRWYFNILLGNKAHPAPEGGHYLVAVARTSGKADVRPGE
jgi:hypothetical protein